jgi:hypothetical protein
MLALGRLGLLGVASPLLTPPWVFNNATIDLDFVNNRYFGPVQIACSRASVAYAADVNGSWLSFPSNVARISNKGFLIEESRTNGIRNNSMQGAAAGTIGGGGAYPTNWANQSGGGANPFGLTVSVAGVVSELGIDCVDIRYQGTPNASADVRLAFEGFTQIAAASGQTWTQSGFVKVTGGSLANIGTARLLQQYRDNVGNSLTTGVFNFTPTATLTRYAGTSLASNAATAFVEPEFAFAVSNGQAIDVTFRIGWPQIELGNFATSPIRTTNAAATRAGDVVTFALPPSGPHFSLYAQGFANFVAGAANSNNARIAIVSDGTSNSYAGLAFDRVSGAAVMELNVGGGNQYFTGLSATNWSGTRVKAMHALADSDQAATAAGVAPTAKSISPIFVPSQAILGGAPGGANQFDGYLERFAYWATIRVPNASQQALTQ